jgi:hypothetical protein
MSKTFRAWKIDEPLFLPPMVGDFVAKDHLACFVLSLVNLPLGANGVKSAYGCCMLILLNGPNTQCLAFQTSRRLVAKIACTGQGTQETFRKRRIPPGHRLSLPDRPRTGIRNWGRPSRPPYVHLHDVA